MSSHTSCTQDHCRRGDGAYCPTAEQLPVEVIAQRQALLDARDAAEQKLLDFEAEWAFSALQESFPNIGSVEVTFDFEAGDLVPIKLAGADSAGRRIADDELDGAYSAIASLLSEEAGHMLWRRRHLREDAAPIVIRPASDAG